MKHLFLLIVVSGCTLPKEAPPPVKTEKTSIAVMQQAGNAILKLLPLVASESQFRNPKNEDHIKESLAQLKQIFTHTDHLQALQTPGFQPSITIIKEHINDTLSAFNRNNKSYAHFLASSTLSICTSCHSQLSENHPSSFVKRARQVPADTFLNESDRAEFYFMVRDYPEALRHYDHIIRKYTAKKPTYMNKHKVERALKKVMTILIKIQRKPALAHRKINEYLRTYKFPQSIRRDMQNWLSQLTAWQHKSDFLAPVISTTTLKNLIGNHLEPLLPKNETVLRSHNEVTLLLASGILSQYINRSKTSALLPQALFWLSMCEQQLSDIYLYSLSDLYLKTCIYQFPQNPMSKRCFQAYKESVLFGFSGSAGTHVPADKQAELDRLQRMVSQKKTL